MNRYQAGIDIGSTTVKLVILDEYGKILYGQYRRHNAQTQQTLADLLKEARVQLGECALRCKITGSGSINLGKAMDIGFVQEVVAVATALKRVAPQTDVAIELGGEDAKIIYFKGGLDERMNGVCEGDQPRHPGADHILWTVCLYRGQSADYGKSCPSLAGAGSVGVPFPAL